MSTRTSKENVKFQVLVADRGTDPFHVRWSGAVLRLRSSSRHPQLTPTYVLLACCPSRITAHTVARLWHLGADYSRLGPSACCQGSQLSRFQEPHW